MKNEKKDSLHFQQYSAEPTLYTKDGFIIPAYIVRDGLTTDREIYTETGLKVPVLFDTPPLVNPISFDPKWKGVLENVTEENQLLLIEEPAPPKLPSMELIRETSVKGSDVLTMDERHGQLVIIDNISGEYHWVTNFIVRPTRKIVRHFRNRNNEVVIELFVSVENGLITQTILVLAKELDGVVSLIKKSIPDAIVNPDASKPNARIANRIRKDMKSVSVVHCFKSVGWISWNEHHIYVHDGRNGDFDGAIFETGQTISYNSSYSAKEAAKHAMQILTISNSLEKILPMFLFAHMSLLFSLFRDAGYEPHCLLFVNGTTGSLKTALCSMLFRFFDSGDISAIPATFKDTSTALEIKMGDAVDSVLLVDDFHPALTAKEKAEMNNILERLIRFYGDGVGKSRSTSTLEKQVEFRPQGLCAITGEDINGTQSSLLRCLLVEIDGQSYDGKKLEIFQQNPLLWTTHLHFFIGVVETYYAEIVTQIKKEFPAIRKEVSSVIRSKRMVDNGVFLIMTSKILLDYFEVVDFVSKIQKHSLQNQWKTAILAILRNSETQASAIDPVKMYIYAFTKLLQSGKFALADSQEMYQSKTTSFVGFTKDGLYFLEPDAVYREVLRYWSSLGKVFSLSEEKTHVALFKSGVSRGQTEQRNGEKKQNYLFRTTLPGRPRFLALDIYNTEKMIEQL